MTRQTPPKYYVYELVGYLYFGKFDLAQLDNAGRISTRECVFNDQRFRNPVHVGDTIVDSEGICNWKICEVMHIAISKRSPAGISSTLARHIERDEGILQVFESKIRAYNEAKLIGECKKNKWEIPNIE